MLSLVNGLQITAGIKSEMPCQYLEGVNTKVRDGETDLVFVEKM